VALITSALTVRIKTQARLAVEREHRTEVLYEINKKLLASRDLQNTIKLINEYMTKIFGRSAIFYTQDPVDSASETFIQSPLDSDASFLLSEDERAVAHWIRTLKTHWLRISKKIPSGLSGWWKICFRLHVLMKGRCKL